MRLVFFFATHREAAATLATVAAVEKAQGSGEYLFSGGEIHIGGMGMGAAQACASKAPSAGCRWVNIGIAGCLEKSVAIGTVLQVGTTSLLQWDVERNRYGYNSEETIVLDDSLAAALFSAPVPMYAPPDVHSALALVDMEGYAFARVARDNNVPLSMVKVVSDFCTDTSHATIRENVDSLSFRLAEVVVDFAKSSHINAGH